MEWLRNLLGPEREGKRLAKDARWIVTDMDVIYSAERMQQVAQMTREKLRECHTALERAPERRAEVIREVQRHHREARRRHDRTALSAFTFAIIYLRAQTIGAPGVPAIQTIDEFLGRWQHTDDEES